MSEHTPGPWCVDETKALGAYGVWTGYATHPGHDGQGYASQICSLLPAKGEIGREQRDANARLIAAAPDLLKTVEGIFPDEDWERHEGVPLGDRITVTLTCTGAELLALRDAIKRARGK